MTKQEYVDYQESVREFFDRTGLTNLSPITTDDNDWEEYFSWQPCECCGSPLGGSRFDCNGAIRNPDGTFEPSISFSVCIDCVYYAEYGRLDDLTMMEVS